MFKIAICDNEVYFQKSIKEFVSQYMEKNSLPCHIDIFNSGKELVSLGIELMRYTVVFLDINMSGTNGIMVAKKIRKISKEVFIVFVTSYMNYTLEGYKVDAVRYLLKNSINFPESINECMDAIIEKLNYKVIEKEFKFNEGVKKVPLERLLYIESKLHKLEFHIMQEELEVYIMYDTLNELENKLKGDGFIRIHQSFLVNKKCIKSILRYKAVLDNGLELIIPKARYRYVKDTFTAYQTGNSDSSF